MRIGADSHHTGAYDALFRQEDVFDTDATDFKVMDDAVFFGKVADNLSQFRRFDVLIGRKMVGHQGDFRLIKDRTADFLKFGNGRRRRNIIGQHHIDVTNN